MGQVGRCFAVDALDAAAVARVATEFRADLVVVEARASLRISTSAGRPAKERLRRLDYCVFGFPGQVGGVEVEQVVVLDAFAGSPAGDRVPDGLEQATCRQIPAGQFQRRRLGQDFDQHFVARERLSKGICQ